MSDMANYCKIHGIYLGDYLRFEDEYGTGYTKVNRITKQNCECGDICYRSCHIFDVNSLYDYIFNHKLTVASADEVTKYIENETIYHLRMMKCNQMAAERYKNENH